MNCVIRNSNLDESSEIAALLRRSIIEICGPDYDNDDSILNDWVENKTIENVSLWINSKKSLTVSCLENGKVIGFCSADLDGEILLLYVLPEFIKKGVGKALYENVENSLANLGIKRLVAYSTITARPFYLKMGLKPFGKAIKVGNYDGEFPLEKQIGI